MEVNHVRTGITVGRRTGEGYGRKKTKQNCRAMVPKQCVALPFSLDELPESTCEMYILNE